MVKGTFFFNRKCILYYEDNVTIAIEERGANNEFCVFLFPHPPTIISKHKRLFLCSVVVCMKNKKYKKKISVKF